MGIDAAVALLIALIGQMGTISAAILKARGEGRDLNADDWKAILNRDDVGKAAQQAALAQSQAEGR